MEPLASKVSLSREGDPRSQSCEEREPEEVTKGYKTDARSWKKGNPSPIDNREGERNLRQRSTWQQQPCGESLPCGQCPQDVGEPHLQGA